MLGIPYSLRSMDTNDCCWLITHGLINGLILVSYHSPIDKMYHSMMVPGLVACLAVHSLWNSPSNVIRDLITRSEP